MTIPIGRLAVFRVAAPSSRAPCRRRAIAVPRGERARRARHRSRRALPPRRLQHVVDDLLLRAAPNRAGGRCRCAGARSQASPAGLDVAAVRCGPRRRRPSFIFASPGFEIELVVDDQDLVGRDGEEARERADRASRHDSCTSSASRGADRPPCRRRRANRDSAPASTRQASSASASANQKPALCRVVAYSRPGLPSPATKSDRVWPWLMHSSERKRPASAPRASLSVRVASVATTSSLSSFLASFLSRPSSFGRARLRRRRLRRAAAAAAAAGAPSAAACRFDDSASTMRTSARPPSRRPDRRLPRDTTVTPGGIFSADTWIEWPTSSSGQVHLDELRQDPSAGTMTSRSVITWLTMALLTFTAGDISPFTKCSGTFMWILRFSSTRWKSTCSDLVAERVHLHVAQQNLGGRRRRASSSGSTHGTLRCAAHGRSALWSSSIGVGFAVPP